MACLIYSSVVSIGLLWLGISAKQANDRMKHKLNAEEIGETGSS
jgi:hypothetical protein